MQFSGIVLPLLGGVMIGLAALVLRAFNGRILDASSIWSGIITRADEFGWRLAFVAGVIVAPMLFKIAGRPVSIQVDASMPVLILAGLLVGAGIALGSACIYGHGIFGVSRLSPRSLAATAVFMSVGIVTVFVVRHVIEG